MPPLSARSGSSLEDEETLQIKYPGTLCDTDDRSSFLPSALSPALIISIPGLEELGEPPHQFVPLPCGTMHEERRDTNDVNYMCGELNNSLNACGGILFDPSHFSVFLGWAFEELCERSAGLVMVGGYSASTIVFITGYHSPVVSWD